MLLWTRVNDESNVTDLSCTGLNSYEVPRIYHSSTYIKFQFSLPIKMKDVPNFLSLHTAQYKFLI